MYFYALLRARKNGKLGDEIKKSLSEYNLNF